MAKRLTLSEWAYEWYTSYREAEFLKPLFPRGFSVVAKQYTGKQQLFCSSVFEANKEQNYKIKDKYK